MSFILKGITQWRWVLRKVDFSHFLLLLLSFLNFHSEVRYLGIVRLPSKCGYQVFVFISLSLFLFLSLFLSLYTHTHTDTHSLHTCVCICLYTQIYISVYIQLVMCCAVLSLSVISDCDPMDCSLSGSSVHGILQARILEWVAILLLQGIFPSNKDLRIVTKLLWHEHTSWTSIPVTDTPTLGFRLPCNSPDEKFHT